MYTLPIHMGKVVHSPSRHWTLWEPFIRNLGLHTYSTTSPCWYSSLGVLWASPLGSSGRRPHDFTCSTVEISCNWWLNFLFYNLKLIKMKRPFSLLYFSLYNRACLNKGKRMLFTYFVSQFCYLYQTSLLEAYVSPKTVFKILDILKIYANQLISMIV